MKHLITHCAQVFQIPAETAQSGFDLLCKRKMTVR